MPRYDNRLTEMRKTEEQPLMLDRDNNATQISSIGSILLSLEPCGFRAATHAAALDLQST